jgi:hypothetical protein
VKLIYLAASWARHTNWLCTRRWLGTAQCLERHPQVRHWHILRWLDTESAHCSGSPSHCPDWRTRLHTGVLVSKSQHEHQPTVVHPLTSRDLHTRTFNMHQEPGDIPVCTILHSEYRHVNWKMFHYTHIIHWEGLDCGVSVARMQMKSAALQYCTPWSMIWTAVQTQKFCKPID